MSYLIYKLIHFFGIIAVVSVLAAGSMHTLKGGTRADHPYRRAFAVAHGVALFLVLLGGFGMLARIGAMHGDLPFWVHLKLVIWVIVGAAIGVVHRGPRFARAVWVALPLLVTMAAAIALYKPGM